MKAQELFYPAPNFGSPALLSQNLRATVTNAPSWNHFDTRIDHRINDKNSLYGRFSWRNLPTPVPEGELPNIGLRDQLRRIRNMSLVDTHTISPRLVNELRAGFAWHENFFQGPLKGLPIVRELGIQGLTTNEDLNGVPNINISGFSSVTQIEHQRSQDMVYDFLDNLTFATGRHSLKIGVNFRKQQASREPIPITIFVAMILPEPSRDSHTPTSCSVFRKLRSAPHRKGGLTAGIRLFPDTCRTTSRCTPGSR